MGPSAGPCPYQLGATAGLPAALALSNAYRVLQHFILDSSQVSISSIPLCTTLHAEPFIFLTLTK